MYMTVEETAIYLSMPVEQVRRYIAEKKIRAVYNGEDFYVNSNQFQTHLEQVEDLKRQIDEWRNTPIPDDIDVKDED
ncbi:excisionase family DNA-binding protein [Psychrobacillus sp.]|uniref:excisionase family DNA-binding protein n=1 Tax=Psychrobacillus sp. TaxID=1871623 RepID=UPI0028BEBAD9|nr:excisionase family DNA-binding protein [Psychrobacillus sp.]